MSTSARSIDILLQTVVEEHSFGFRQKHDLVELAKNLHADEERRAVPPHIIKRVESCGDCRYRLEI
jgi:hypothetical protein